MNKSTYKFKGHQSFYARSGWLFRGLTSVDKNHSLFSIDFPQDELGIGSNMVTAIKYWLQAFDLIRPVGGNSKKQREYIPTELGELIINKDAHMQSFSTLCYLHYILVKNYEMATSWNIFFNNLELTEFTKNDVLKKISIMFGEKVALSSIVSDIDCILNMYLNDKNEESIAFDEVRISPFARLRLINNGNNSKTFEKKCIDTEKMDPYMVYSILLSQLGTRIVKTNQYNIQIFMTEENSIGKIFNLDYQALFTALNEMEKEGLLKVTRTAGLETVTLLEKITSKEALKMYFERIDIV